MSAIAPITDADPTEAEMEARIARRAALRPTDAYVDAGIPGCERTTYAVLGSGPAAALPAAAVDQTNVVEAFADWTCRSSTATINTTSVAIFV
jgi:hypothetical protein